MRSFRWSTYPLRRGRMPTGFARRRLLVGILGFGILGLVVLWGWEPSVDESLPPFTPSDFPGLAGIWTVVGHRAPEVSAMSSEEADEWIGESIEFRPWEAFGPESGCIRATYRIRSVDVEPYFRDTFRVVPEMAGVPEHREQVSIQEMDCGGRPWADLGGVLIMIDWDRALVPWEGVLFELERDRSSVPVVFRAVGNEPGWIVEIVEERYIRFHHAYGARDAYIPLPEPSFDFATTATVYHGVTEEYDLRVTIEPVACSDTMSGRGFASTVTVILNGEVFRGCGTETP